MNYRKGFEPTSHNIPGGLLPISMRFFEISFKDLTDRCSNAYIVIKPITGNSRQLRELNYKNMKILQIVTMN